MAQNLVLDGTIFNGVDSISMTNTNGDKITYIEKINAGTGVPVAIIGEREFYTVEEALRAAISGDTVVMIADSVENVSLIIPSGVTLNLQSNTLTAERIIGLDGSYLTANTKTSSVQSGCLVVAKDNVTLSHDCYRNSSNYGILPIWMDDHFEFSLFNIQVTTTKQGLYVDESKEEIKFVFAHQQSGTYKEEMINGGLDNGIKVIVVLSWIGQEDETFNCTCTFADSIFTQIAAGNNNYTFILNGYGAMYIDLDTMQIVGKVISDTGAACSSKIFTKADDKLN